jgi:hypothetical protein
LTGSSDHDDHRGLHRRLPLVIALLFAAVVVALLIARMAG